MAILQRLEINGFRNLRDVRLTPHPKLNFFAGANGAGKTALLEAIHYLVRGKSFRSSQTTDLIGHDVEQLLIRTALQVEEFERVEVDAAVLRPRHKRQQIRWRGAPVNSFARISSNVPLQVFLPSLSDLVFGGPGERRRWLDWGTFHVEHRYLDHWRSYSRLLHQRNALLRALGNTESLTRSSEFTSFTEAMITAAELVTTARRAYLKAWNPYFETRLAQLSQGTSLESTLTLSLKPFGSSKSLSLRDLLGESTPREVKSGITVYGPHRADCELNIGSLQAASIASRGQGKLIALAMMIAQADVVAARSNVASVLLMDDLDAELDEIARAQLYEVLADCRAQAFITGVNPGPEMIRTASAAEGSYAMFHVEHGSVTQETA